ncbi:MAG: non-ribosomal peptide synthetase [Saprospiraceae bacterium]|jgi:acyl-CoA synthetase (AMP-forming)/AMP-acid ligase II|nr:non-ribosomal peptide synthetase [Saprospiraceae bacterium]
MQRVDTEGKALVTLPNLFLQSVQRYGPKIAIATIDGEISFEELNRNAEKWAYHLAHLAQAKCLIILQPGLEYYTALVACMKANCLAIPVDATLPQAKIMELMTDAGAGMCLCSESVASTISLHIQQNSTYILTPSDLNQETESKWINEIPADDFLLHCLYTSGSSGRQTRVYFRQSSMVHDVLTSWETYRINKESINANLGAYTSSLHINGLWRSLIQGGTYISGNVKKEGWPELQSRIYNYNATVLQGQPALLRSYLAQAVPEKHNHIRHLVLGGEEIRPSQLQALLSALPALELLTYNYSCTETMLICSVTKPAEVFLAWQKVPAGLPGPGKTIRIYSENGTLATDGEVGEIFVESPFIADTLEGPEAELRLRKSKDDHSRTYATGDLGRINEEGLLEHLGRKDRQIKINGVRIDPVLIENALLSLLDASQVLVIPIQTEGHQQIAAAISPSLSLDTHYLNSSLAEKLPLSHIPALYISMDNFPLTERGKTDVHAIKNSLLESLRNPDTISAQPSERGPTSLHQICSIWSSFLENKAIKSDIPLFHQGADSLTAMLGLQKLQKTFHLELPPSFIVSFPTPFEQAKEIDRKMLENMHKHVKGANEDLVKRLGF